MKTSRKVGIGLLLVVFAGLTVWWMLYVPYDPDKVYRAIPASVEYVSIHRDLPTRWETLTSNPISLSLLQSAGVDLDELAELNKDPTFQPMFRKLAGDLVMLAYLPPTAYSSEPAWIFGSWLGGGSQRLRWMLSLGIVPGYDKKVTASGRPYWVAQDSGLEEGLELSIAIEEGVLIGCISKQAGNIEQAVGAFEGSIPSLAPVATSVFNSATAQSSTDVGWAKLPNMKGRALTPDAHITYALVDDGAGGVRGRMTFSDPWLPEHDMQTAFQVEGLGELLGDLPFGAVVLHPDLLQATRASWAALLREFIHEQGATPTCMALLGGDYSSRFQLFKIPSLCVVSRIEDQKEAMAGMDRLLDRVNAVYRLGLIQTEEMVGAHRVFVVEGTTGDLYSKLGRDQRCAYTVLDDWLLVASSKSVLQRLLARYDGVEDANDAPWVAASNEERSSAYVSLDMEECGKALRLAVSVYRITAMMGEAGKNDEVRERLELVNSWVNALMPLETCKLWVKPKADQTIIQFRLGPESGDLKNVTAENTEGRRGVI